MNRSPRPSTYVDRHPLVRDVWGNAWHVYDRRPTAYGFAIMLGRPYGYRGRIGGQGGKLIIVTPAFAKWVRANGQRPFVHPIPISIPAYQRVRRALGVDHRFWIDTRLTWWLDRIDDLGAMTAREFVAQHGGTAWTRTGTLGVRFTRRVRMQLLGRHRRPRDWWHEPAVLALLQSDKPWQVVSKRLEIPRYTVYLFRRRARSRRSRRTSFVKSSRKHPLSSVNALKKCA